MTSFISLQIKWIENREEEVNTTKFNFVILKVKQQHCFYYPSESVSWAFIVGIEWAWRGTSLKWAGL
jgi:hypothetical protein